MARIEFLEPRRLLTTLIFGPATFDGDVLPQEYGDRVTTSPQDGFEYENVQRVQRDGSETPHVDLKYGPVSQSFHKMSGGYGDLHDVLTCDQSSFDITLEADLSTQGVLKSLDLAGANNQDYTIKSLTVFDGFGQPLFAQNNVVVQGDAVGEPHTHLAFNHATRPLSRVLRIHIDVSNIETHSAIGVDNVSFYEVPLFENHERFRIGDGYPDIVQAFHDTGSSGMKGPYGGNSIMELAVPISPGVALGSDDDPDNPSYLTLSKGSFAVLNFADETIVDGPGADLSVEEIGLNPERAQFYVSSNFTDYKFIGIAKGGVVTRFDLADIGYKRPVRSVKIVSQTNAGASPGFDVGYVHGVEHSLRSETFRFPLGDGVEAPTRTIASSGVGSLRGTLGRRAVEYATPANKPVFPMLFGVVSAVIGEDPILGNAILIRHRLADGSELQTGYAHLSSIAVKVADEVEADTQIGLTGATGSSTQPNLRFGISDLSANAGLPPREYIRGSGSLPGEAVSRFSTFVDAESGTDWRVTGTAGNDQIELLDRAGKIEITRNGITRVLDAAAVGQIAIFASAGDDRVDGSGTSRALVENGEAGNDILVGGSGDDSLYGGTGNDSLVGGAGTDLLRGGGQRDTLKGGER